MEVGAAERTTYIYALHDDTGDNISLENTYYGELSGLYWIWKNADIADDEIIGLFHYSRGLCITSKEIEKVFKQDKADWITAKAQNMPGDIAEGLEHTSVMLAILKKDYPIVEDEYHKIYQEDGSSKCCIPKNMFITTGKELNSYCEFLFDVMAKCRAIIGDVDLDKYQKRYCAFLAERLFGAWLNANYKRVLQKNILLNSRGITIVSAFIKKIPFTSNSKCLNFLRRIYRKYITESAYKS